MLVITPQITEHYGKIKRRWLQEGKGSHNCALCDGHYCYNSRNRRFFATQVDARPGF